MAQALHIICRTAAVYSESREQSVVADLRSRRRNEKSVGSGNDSARNIGVAANSHRPDQRQCQALPVAIYQFTVERTKHSARQNRKRLRYKPTAQYV